MKEMYNSFKDKSNYLVVATFNDVVKAINKVYDAIQYKDIFRLKTKNLYFSNLNHEESYPKGESPKQFYERVVEYIKELNDKYQNKNVVIVSHQGVYGILKSYVKGNKWTNKIKFNIGYVEIKIL